MKTPDITPAQILSSVLALIGLLVTQGAVDNETGKLIGGVASIVIPAAWQIADAVIRHGRAKTVAAEASASTVSEGGVTWKLAAGSTVESPALELAPKRAARK